MALSIYNNFINIVVSADKYKRGQYENINIYNSVEVSGEAIESGVFFVYHSNDKKQVLFPEFQC